MPTRRDRAAWHEKRIRAHNAVGHGFVCTSMFAGEPTCLPVRWLANPVLFQDFYRTRHVVLWLALRSRQKTLGSLSAACGWSLA